MRRRTHHSKSVVGKPDIWNTRSADRGARIVVVPMIGPATHSPFFGSSQPNLFRVVVFVNAPLIHVAAHIQGPDRRGPVRIHAYSCRALKAVVLGVGPTRIPFSS